MNRAVSRHSQKANEACVRQPVSTLRSLALSSEKEAPHRSLASSTGWDASSGSDCGSCAHHRVEVLVAAGTMQAGA
eukprot:4517429-Pleurochrysis_carterae.AAC.1